MNKKIWVINILLAILFSFSLIEAAEDDYQISKVPCKIESFISRDKLYINITLADGLEIADTYENYKCKDSLICFFRVKVTDGYLFPDSEGYPLSNFEIIVFALNNPENNSLAILIEEVTEVLHPGWIFNETCRLTSFNTINYVGVRLNLFKKPQLIKFENTSQQGQVVFNIIFND
jgi:hypothetical protein